MKYLLLFLLLTSCAGEKKDPSIYGHLTVQGSLFEETQAPLFKETVEASLVYKDNELIYLTNTGSDGSNLFLNSKSESFKLVAMHNRFSYVMKYNGLYYNFYLKSLSTGDVYLSKSSDLIHWTEINNSQPVLTQSPNSIYSSIWNVGVTVDDQGVWHLLAETSSAGNDVAGLAYSTATLQGDQINFDANKASQHLMATSGNPWVRFVPGKGIIALYGKYNAGIWEVRGGVLSNGVLTESPTFNIFESGIHICDPYLEETPQGTVLVLSYDQHALYELRTPQTLSDLYEVLK